MIELSYINKSFKVYKRQAGLKEAVKGLFNREYEEIHALRDISFKVDKTSYKK